MCDHRLNPGVWKKELPDGSHSKNREEIPSSSPYREESSLLQMCCPKLSRELTKKIQGTKLSTQFSQDMAFLSVGTVFCWPEYLPTTEGRTGNERMRSADCLILQ